MQCPTLVRMAGDKGLGRDAPGSGAAGLGEYRVREGARNTEGTPVQPLRASQSKICAKLTWVSPAGHRVTG